MIKMTALVIMALVPVPVIGAVKSKALLVRLETRYSAPDFNTRNEIFVFRDGSVHHRVRSTSHGEPTVLRIVRLQASPAQMTALGSSLQLNRVGFQAGGCAFRADNPLLGHVQAQVDWFGKPPRQKSFAVDSKFPESCDHQVDAIVEAIEGIAESATEVDAKTAKDLIENFD